MSEVCEAPVSMERLSDYFHGELGPAAEDAVESHLFRCPSCSEEASRLAGVLSSVAAAVPLVLSSKRLAELERAGRIQAVNVMRAGETATVTYPDANRLLVHRLGGIDFSRAQRVDFEIRDPGGQALMRLEDVPFDRERGEVLVPCQSHFADMYPRDVVFTVVGMSEEGHEALARYAVEHRLV